MTYLPYLSEKVDGTDPSFSVAARFLQTLGIYPRYVYFS
jgi:hypothetical protein